ncbi:YkvI family membrane protein [Gracilibacillus alcaliphilus]|uniref:YkvI family membrane protein n=1 Tax=Gracilibacillus alcaliphilus TaxID=1401441 RepID=UPI00195AFD8E|nr:GerAB/ArcD/ProY family transporter [Gracilibacillus alcaliphilus]MBM7678713.1 putative membrane protein YkvI [Gracilibacillus alcaliphilus]
MWRAGFKWIFLILGIMVGAGYTSGRELWQFFGHESGLAIILFTLFFIFCIAIVMKASYRFQTTNYFDLLTIMLGKQMARFYDFLIFFYLLSTTVIMTAGSGATFEAFSMPKWAGILFLAVLSVILFIKGLQGVLQFNSFVMPVLMVGLVAMLLLYSMDEQITWDLAWERQSNWMAAFTFTALNILSILAVLGAIGDQIRSNGEIWIASIGSGLILGATSFLYNNSLVHIADMINFYEIPLFAILQNYSVYTNILMSILLWFAIFTTAVSGMLALVTRLKPYFPFPMWKIALVLFLCLLPLTSIGFSALIGFLYPLYGIVNLYLFCAILLFPFYKKI